MLTEAIDKLIMIAHRGNLEGPRPNLENRPDYIKTALDAGFTVEVDVWVKGEVITLGHDKGVYPADLDFIKNPYILCHAKNFEAVELFNKQPDIHWFWHEKDCCTLTSWGWIWAYPHNRIEGSILNQPEINQSWNPEEAIGQFKWYVKNCSFKGVCSDYVKTFKDLRDG